MNNANNTAPVMVELKNDEVIIKKWEYQYFLETVLEINKDPNTGMTPFDLYRRLLSKAIDMFRFEKNSGMDMNKISAIQNRIQMINIYFEHFVQLNSDPIVELKEAGTIDLRKENSCTTDVQDIF